MSSIVPHEIRHVAMLDLTGAGAAEMLEGVTRIVNVATILIPESLLPRLSSIPMENVATVVPVPQGSRVRVLSGQMVLSGEALENADGKQDEVLVVAGQLVVTSPVKRVGYHQLIAMGQVLAPTGSETGLGAGLTRMSGQVHYYPYREGGSVRVLTGPTRMSAAELANPTGEPTDVLLSVGPLIIQDIPERVGFDRIVTVGQVLAPVGSEAVLAGRIAGAPGEVFYYSAPPRVFDGKETFYGAFFELLDEPITLVLDGKFSFDEDVSPQVLKEKVAAIVFDGKLIAPRRLVPVLQLLAVARDGKILADDAAVD
ncbi:MAG: hypothetical protein JOZ81_20540 [Chloroflexi bacterium]|nr:hypothetical protein [Chloroflexota bacterium]MBV9545160.1 hypothetical protein [Chloroflexota bacterium]